MGILTSVVVVEHNFLLILVPFEAKSSYDTPEDLVKFAVLLDIFNFNKDGF